MKMKRRRGIQREDDDEKRGRRRSRRNTDAYEKEGDNEREGFWGDSFQRKGNIYIGYMYVLNLC